MEAKLKASSQFVIEGYDWGPVITAIILEAKEFGPGDEPATEMFQAYIRKQNVKHEIKIRKIEMGRGTLTIHPAIHPSFAYLTAHNYNHIEGRSSFDEFMEFSLELKGELKTRKGTFTTVEIVGQKASLIPVCELFGENEYHFDHRTTLKYYLHEPSGKKDMPLIVWLHGAGEGGSDKRIALTGNPVSRLVEPDIQTVFGKACVLVPQAPTFWMDAGDGTYTADGKAIYLKALHGLIEKVVYKNAKIDRHRIYVGGCSNGGYMTIALLIHYPESYAAGFPICEAYHDKWITAEDLKALAGTPLWFTHAHNDPVVPCEKFSVATYERLLRQGAKDVELSLFDAVRDYSGLYQDASGNPYGYHGHLSWILTLNRQCRKTIDTQEVELFSWLREKARY